MVSKIEDDNRLVVTRIDCNNEPADESSDQKTVELIEHSCQLITRLDDSVIAVTNQQPITARRARGYVPDPIILSHEVPAILGLGGQNKNTLCIIRGKEAFVSQLIGDLNNPSAIHDFHQTLTYLLKVLNIKPDYVAHDLHPDFYTTRIAENFAVPAFPVQHHHAHLASVAAEYSLQGPVLGLALDGFGLGDNQQHWGGELFFLQGSQYRRLACLRPLPQPGGGEVVAREPWRMALAVLFAANLESKIPHLLKEFKYGPLLDLLKKQIHCPLTSSCGRLFDAVSALLGVCSYCTYDGQAALELEALMENGEVVKEGWTITENYLDLLPIIPYLLGQNPSTAATIFHMTLAAALTEWVKQYAASLQIKTVLLSGGCFINNALSALLVNNLQEAGLTPLLPKQLPPNDGGLSLGQAWVITQMLSSSSS
jgi:hydrogenase maturation protein HypF